MNSETRLFYIALAGLTLAAISLAWLIVAAFRVKWSWGLLVLVFLPVALPIFVVRHIKAARWPLVLMAVGLAVGSAPIIYNQVTPVDLGAYEKLVGNEIHLTLTKWGRKDYSILSDRPGTVVLQMANPDVTDATLINLKGMTLLKELDISYSQVGDDGLKELEPLTGLESLRLRGTRITEAGFQKWLVPREALKQLDLHGTAVTKESGKAWQDAKAGRRLVP